MIALLGLLLTAQHQGDIKISSGPIAFAETGQRGAVLELTSTGLWRYSETLKEWLPIFAADIRNVSTTAWRDLELTLVISGPDKAEFRIPMTVGSIIEPGETLPYEKFFFGKVGADQLRSASSFSLEMSSASKKQNIPFQGFSGIWLQAEDCAQDHQSLMKLTGIALRERLLKFVSLGCGALVSAAEVKLTKLKSPPGFISVELDGKAGWIPLGSVKTFLRAEFRSTGLVRLQ